MISRKIPKEEDDIDLAVPLEEGEVKEEEVKEEEKVKVNKRKFEEGFEELF